MFYIEVYERGVPSFTGPYSFWSKPRKCKTKMKKVKERKKEREGVRKGGRVGGGSPSSFELLKI